MDNDNSRVAFRRNKDFNPCLTIISTLKIENIIYPTKKALGYRIRVNHLEVQMSIHSSISLSVCLKAKPQNSIKLIIPPNQHQPHHSHHHTQHLTHNITTQNNIKMQHHDTTSQHNITSQHHTQHHHATSHTLTTIILIIIHFIFYLSDF